MAALINYINNTQNKHIIAIEDPIEFMFRSNKSLIEQREV
jgi:twitching motility protein PilT